MAETKSRWIQVTDSAAQATKNVVERTQELAQKIDSGVRREALDDVRKAREMIKKADQGLGQLFDRIEHWAKTEPKAKSPERPKGAAADAPKKAAASKAQGAQSQPS